MATATVEIWRDTGFTEGSVEVPSKTSSLPNPTYTFYNVNTPRDSLFSTLKLAHAFEDLYDCSYLRITLDMNNGSDVTLYGWIDSVSCGSDTAGYPNTIIDWHPDLWRSYINSAQFGAGLVTRRPYGSDCPPQLYPFRFKDVHEENVIVPRSNIWWVVFKFVHKQKFLSSLITANCIGTFPIDIDAPMNSFTVSGPDMEGSDTVTAKTIPYAMLAGGFFEEFLKLDPNTLVSVFLSPVCPFDVSVSSGTYSGDLSVYRAQPIPGSEYFGFLVKADANPFKEYTITTSDLKTDDIFTTLITDFMGNTVGAIPWGLTINTWKYRVVMDANQGYIDLRGFPKYTEYGVTVTETRGTMTPVLGTDYTIPLIPMEITDNTLGSYNWSGQRAADRQAIQNQALMGIMTGIAGMPGDIASGYLFANAGGSKKMEYQDIRQRGDALRAWNSMVDNPNWSGFGMMGNPSRAEYANAGRQLGYMNAATGAMMRATGAMSAIGLGASAITSLISMGMQDSANVKAHAAQTNNLALLGTGFDPFNYGQPITAVTMMPDAYSRNQREQDLAINGAKVSEPRQDITSLIDSGGPLQILNPVVKGPIPTPAKEYIKQRLESGVRII